MRRETIQEILTLEFKLKKLNRELDGLKPKQVNHILHLILSVLTAGLWLPVWIILSLPNFDSRRRPLKNKIAKIEDKILNLKVEAEYGV